LSYLTVINFDSCCFESHDEKFNFTGEQILSLCLAKLNLITNRSNQVSYKLQKLIDKEFV